LATGTVMVLATMASQMAAKRIRLECSSGSVVMAEVLSGCGRGVGA